MAPLRLAGRAHIRLGPSRCVERSWTVHGAVFIAPIPGRPMKMTQADTMEIPEVAFWSFAALPEPLSEMDHLILAHALDGKGSHCADWRRT